MKTIVFDFGGVVINIDFKRTHDAFKQLGVDNLDQLFSQNTQSGFFDDFEKGLVTSEAFRAHFLKDLPQNISVASFDEAWNSMLLDIPKERIEILKLLKKDYKIALLSNTNLIHYNCYRSYFEATYGYKKFSDLFDYTFFSHDIALRKPHADIYEYAAAEMKMDFSDLLFIDDTHKNIEAAQSLGIPSVFWQNKAFTDLPQMLKKYL